ncbi:MAG: hypothetical protein QHH13_09835 [Melioribacter sp.]|uniref:hypothetical protein n=1 Tax=Rosettibacter primus TaxID=3111523 RepID=UPI00247DDEE2|nr:hypothetical protein [Melioribacter sp.]
MSATKFPIKNFIALPIFIIITACSSIPKESIELSLTAGRDISAMQQAHLELIDLFYNRLISDVNRFIDEVYTPYQTEKLLEEFSDELLDESPKGEKKINLEKIKIILEELYSDIEYYRKSKLKPLVEQRDSIKQNIINSYNRIIYANSVVTAHLASIIKVKDAQLEILQKLDLNSLPQNISSKLSSFSDSIFGLTEKMKNKKENTEKVIEQFDKLIKDISK